MISLILAEKICGLLLILLIGVLIVKLGILSSEDSRVISKLSAYVVAPCTIITSYQVQFDDEIKKGLLITLAAAVLTQFFYTMISKVYVKAFRLNEVEHAMLIYSNSLNLIIPLVSAILGSEWVIYSSMYSSFQTFMIWSNGKSILCGEKKPDLKKVFKNINIICVFIGLILMALGITRFPGPIQTTIENLGSMVGVTGMLTMGMLIGGMDLKKLFTYKRTLFVSLMRLIVMPLPVVLFFKWGPFASMIESGQNLMLIVILAACAPGAVLISQVAQIYGKDARYASAIGVVSTLLCILTMPLMVSLYNL